MNVHHYNHSVGAVVNDADVVEVLSRLIHLLWLVDEEH
jgi:hypothetical protein